MKEQEKRFRFSAEKLAAIPAPEDGPATFYDTDVKGLGFRIQPSGAAVFFLFKKVAGKPYRKTLGKYPDLKLDAARKHSHRLLSEIADWQAGDRKDANPMVRPFDGDTVSFESAFKMYLAAPLKNELKGKVVNREKANQRRQYIFDKYLDSLAARPIDDITVTVVAALHKRLSDKHGPIAANRVHEVVRAVFNHLIKKGLWATVNPAVGATRAPARARARVLQDEEYEAFFAALDAEKNTDFAEFLGLALATGVRVGNLYSAEWTEINLRERTWTIPGSKYKNGTTTTLALSQEAVELFARRRQRRTIGVPWVFATKAGSKSGHVEDYKNEFKRVKAAAGLLAGVTCCDRAKELFEESKKPQVKETDEGEVRCLACGKQDFRFHDIRRSFVANLIQSNIPLPVASKCAGHANLSSMQPYARFSKGAEAKALEQGVEGRKRRMDEAKQLTA